MITRRKLFRILAAAPAAGVAVLAAAAGGGLPRRFCPTRRRWTRIPPDPVDVSGGYLIPGEVLEAHGGVIASWNRCLSQREIAAFYREWRGMFSSRST